MNVRKLPERVLHRTKRVYREGLTSVCDTALRLTDRVDHEGRFTDLLRRRLWNINRSYQPNESLQIDDSQKFEKLLSEIATGLNVSQEELLPYLCLEQKVDRAQVNALLADAYFQRRSGEATRQAGQFIRRAWLLSNFNPELLDLYVKILAELDDIEGIRNAFKRLGLDAARGGDISEAIHYFDGWHSSYHRFRNIDKFEYDFDVLECMDNLARPYRVSFEPDPLLAKEDRVRLAYVLRGLLEPNSILVAISLEFAKHHDKSRFDVTFFAPETESAIKSSPHGKKYLASFAGFGYSVVTAPELDELSDRLLSVANDIAARRPHMLVTNAVLADFSQYFLASLRPAPVVLGIVQGPPAQFAAPVLDWTISWTKHPLMDCPVNCSWVQIKLDYPVEVREEPYKRKDLGLPEGCPILMSAGRHPKFQDSHFWCAITELLSEHSDAHYVVVGAHRDDIPALKNVTSDEVTSRIHCLGWREDFLRILPNADVVIDTYPNGGGQVIVQAMACGIPIVAQRNNYMQLFDQNDWSPVEDFITDPEIVVQRGDFEQFKRVIAKLLSDVDYRTQVGEKCRAEHLRHADASKAIRGCEDVYLRVLKHL